MKLYEFTAWPDLTVSMTEQVIQDEPALDRAFEEIEPDWTVLDAGASIGYYSVLAAQRANKGLVVAVEAHPIIADVLERNLSLHGLTNVKVVRKALIGGDFPQFIHMHETEGRGGTQISYEKPPVGSRLFASLKDGSLPSKIALRIKRKLHPVGRKRDLSVATCTIDRIVKELGLKEVHLIKMDIQGAEYDALKGAVETLRTKRPKLLIELHERPQWTTQDLINLVKKENYEIKSESAGHAGFLIAEPAKN